MQKGEMKIGLQDTLTTMACFFSRLDSKFFGGILFLTLCFFTIKVLGYLNWPWLWIFSPLWITGGLITLGLITYATTLWLMNKL